jgi:hypothetical protein
VTRLRNSWIVLSIALALGAATVLYVAHLGEGSHAGDCEVCDLAANQSAVEPGAVTGEADAVLLECTPGLETDEVLTTAYSTAAPRAPPIS